MKRNTKQTALLYLRIAGHIEQQIIKEVLRTGDRLPSLRTLCREYGVSQSTALQVYHYLETKSLVVSRPQSGYFVQYAPGRFPAIPQSSQPRRFTGSASIEELVDKVYSNLGNDRNIPLSLGVPAASLLPIARLNKEMIRAVRELHGSGVLYEQVQGNEKLRRQIARRSLVMEAGLQEDDLVITAGCLNAISWCLMALTQRGDTIAMESPVSFGMLQVAQSLGLQIAELPTHPQTGIDPDTLKKVFATKKIRVCLLISNFSNPLGSCMPDEHKKEAVRLAVQYNIPVIENDLNGDIYFGPHRPRSCKTYDESGLVLWCGSVSKTLAPGYRTGWIAPGRFKEKILRMKSYHSISSTSVTQEAVAGFLETGRYEHHLNKLRHTLHANCLQYIKAIADYFPEGTKASRPAGGFVLWVEMNRKIDTTALYEAALLQKISIAPGRMFTLQKQYGNCMRLNYGLPWDSQVLQALKTVGKLAKAALE